MLLVTEAIESKRNRIANKDISTPLNGKIARLEPRPSAAASPIPHEAHPGRSMPEAIPRVESAPTLALDLGELACLRKRRMEMSIPVRILIIIKV